MFSLVQVYLLFIRNRSKKFKIHAEAIERSLYRHILLHFIKLIHSVNGLYSVLNSISIIFNQSKRADPVMIKSWELNTVSFNF